VNSFEGALDWLYSTQQFGIKPGLELMLRLAGALGLQAESDPSRNAASNQAAPAYIHVAGTNGKGSTCAFIAAICKQAGLRTGLYTSPHLICFRERIQINGLQIPESDVLDGLRTIQTMIQDWQPHPTFFEITTALAMRWFQQKHAEVVVVETGMGGRLDATNIVNPLVSVITPIAFDHEQYLGSTLDKIAFEKAGIIKRCAPVVSAPQDPIAADVLNTRASELGTPISYTNSPYDGPLELRGVVQNWNAALAIKAIKSSGLSIDDATIREGLSKAEWPGRFQIISENLVLDGAHNPNAACVLAENWRSAFGEGKACLIFGCMADKDIEGVLENLRPITASIQLSPIQSPRAVSVSHLQKLCHKLMPGVLVQPHDSLKAALGAQMEHRRLVTGSLFLVGEALGIIQGSSREASLQ
jgi:dihydrofolate synthase/folylpolyglutamate synthase